jgi:hypothetical protein
VARPHWPRILDHVTVDADVITIAADLKTLAMHPVPSCR